MKKKKTMHKEMDMHMPSMPMSNKGMHPHRKKLVVEGLVMALPLAATFAWYSFLIFSSTSISGAGARFAPGKIETLVLFILLFIIVYSVFLIFEFKHMKKRWDKIE
jgi:hypothetical protein